MYCHSFGEFIRLVSRKRISLESSTASYSYNISFFSSTYNFIDFSLFLIDVIIVWNIYGSYLREILFNFRYTCYSLSYIHSYIQNFFCSLHALLSVHYIFPWSPPHKYCVQWILFFEINKRDDKTVRFIPTFLSTVNNWIKKNSYIYHYLQCTV